MEKKNKLNLLFKLSYLNWNFPLTLGYLNPVLNNPPRKCILLSETIRNRVPYDKQLTNRACSSRTGDYYMAKPVLGKSVRSDWFFLGRDSAVQTVSVGTVQVVYFCFGAKPANSKFATKTAKKCSYCHSSQRNYQKKLKRLKFYWDFKDGWRGRTFP